MKALKLLKILRDDYIHGELDEDINEAINELEEAMKPKKCSSCKYWDFNEQGHFKRCFNGKGNVVSTEADFGCNRWEKKDNA